MSVVDNYVLKLAAGVGRSGFVEALNAKLLAEYPSGAKENAFVGVTAHAGGPKHLEVDIYLAALNYVHPSSVADIVTKMIISDTSKYFPFGYQVHDVELFCQTEHECKMVRYFPAEG